GQAWPRRLIVILAVTLTRLLPVRLGRLLAVTLTRLLPIAPAIVLTRLLAVSPVRRRLRVRLAGRRLSSILPRPWRIRIWKLTHRNLTPCVRSLRTGLDGSEVIVL
ncbi:MAG: hypothetical protein M3Z75_23815, partial [Actinomycetota bacterium]|nr:hypothetical protein [Actinomycetota bacterium]